MADTKMLQAILNGQTAIKEELIGKICNLEEKVDKGFGKTDEQFEELEKRLDKLGLSLAQLSDDAPTNEELDNLEKKVTKLERQLTKN